MAVEIVRAGPGEAALLERVAEDVFDDAIHPERLKAYLQDPGHVMLLAMDAGLVVGQCRGIVHRHPDVPTELNIDNLGVTPARQREGVGKRLVEEMLSIGRAMGGEVAWVATEPDNEPARGLYGSFGAEPETFVLYLLEGG
jgi:aminoglycoside 6'-N-acetyltransferase I